MQHPATKLTAATTSRYQLTLCAGPALATIDTDDLALAQAELDAFAQVHAGDKDCHGGIYDRTALKYVANVWCRPKALTGEALFMATRGESWWPAIAKRAAQMGGGL